MFFLLPLLLLLLLLLECNVCGLVKTSRDDPCSVLFRSCFDGWRDIEDGERQDGRSLSHFTKPWADGRYIWIECQRFASTFSPLEYVLVFGVGFGVLLIGVGVLGSFVFGSFGVGFNWSVGSNCVLPREIVWNATKRSLKLINDFTSRSW